VIVKKLTDEVEFLPVLRKQPHIIDLKHTTTTSNLDANESVKKPSTKFIRIPVEIVGVQQRPNTAHNRGLYEVNETTTTSTSSQYEKDVDDEKECVIERPTLVRQKSSSAKRRLGHQKMGEALTHGNYLRIIDTLTNRYVNGESSEVLLREQQNQSQNNKSTKLRGSKRQDSIKLLEKKLINLLEKRDADENNELLYDAAYPNGTNLSNKNR
jgi:hypothetical protein